MNINMNKDLLILVGSVSIMFVAVIVILANNIMSSDRNFTAIIKSGNTINDTLAKMETAQPQGNFTAQKIAVANIEHIMDTVDDINRTLTK